MSVGRAPAGLRGLLQSLSQPAHGQSKGKERVSGKREISSCLETTTYENAIILDTPRCPLIDILEGLQNLPLSEDRFERSIAVHSQ